MATEIKNSENHPNALDLAVVNPRKVGKETRYDIAAIDLRRPQYPVIQTRLGKRFVLAAERVAPAQGRIQASWQRMLEEEPSALVEYNYVTDRNLIDWALGRPTMIDGQEFHSLQQFIDAQEQEPAWGAEDDEAEVDGDLGVDPDSAREIFRISPPLAGVLPFLPTVAYPLNGGDED